MTVVVAALLGAVILAGAVHDTVRMITPHESSRPLLARLRGRRAALEADERSSTRLLLHGHMTPADYRTRMSGLAHGGSGPTAVRQARRRGGRVL